MVVGFCKVSIGKKVLSSVGSVITPTSKQLDSAPFFRYRETIIVWMSYESSKRGITAMLYSKSYSPESRRQFPFPSPCVTIVGML